MTKQETFCFSCKISSRHAEMHMHHVVPISVYANDGTVPLCSVCHALVHDSLLVASRKLSADAIRARSAEGNPVGKAPFGWKWRNGTKVEDEHEQATLRRCMELLKQKPVLSISDIAKKLEEEGHTTRSGGKPTRATVQKWICAGNMAPLVNGALSGPKSRPSEARRREMTIQERVRRAQEQHAARQSMPFGKRQRELSDT